MAVYSAGVTTVLVYRRNLASLASFPQVKGFYSFSSIIKFASKKMEKELFCVIEIV